MEVVKNNGLTEIFCLIVSKIHLIKYEMNNHEQQLLSVNNYTYYSVYVFMHVCVYGANHHKNRINQNRTTIVLGDLVNYK